MDIETLKENMVENEVEQIMLAETKEEYLDALDTEKATARYNELENMRTRAVNPNARTFAERALYFEFGVGDLQGQFNI